MITRVKGAPAQGVWFSADIRFLLVDTDNTTFLTDLTVKTTEPYQADVVNSNLEITLELVAQFGTIIGFNVVDGGNVSVMVDYAQGYGSENTTVGGGNSVDVTGIVEAAVVAETAATTCAITVFAGFAGAAQGTPA